MPYQLHHNHIRIQPNSGSSPNLYMTYMQLYESMNLETWMISRLSLSIEEKVEPITRTITKFNVLGTKHQKNVGNLYFLILNKVLMNIRSVKHYRRWAGQGS